MAQVKKAILLEVGKKTQGARNDILSIVDKKLEETPHNTQKTIANDLGWSTGKVQWLTRYGRRRSRISPINLKFMAPVA